MRTPIQQLNDDIEGCIGCSACCLVLGGGGWLIGLWWQRLGIPAEISFWLGVGTTFVLWQVILWSYIYLLNRQSDERDQDLKPPSTEEPPGDDNGAGN